MIAWGMPRFYCPQPLAPGQQTELPDAVVRHLRVLRLPEGAPVTLFNGEGGEFEAVLRLNGKNVQAEILAHLPVERESLLNLQLAQALVASEKMDWVLQKAVELGVNMISPLMMRRCNVSLKGERSEKKYHHWQGVVAAACEQSGRNRMPQVAPLQDLEAWLAQLPAETCRYLLDPEGEPLASVAPVAQAPVVLVVGPEGGFAAEEKTLLIQHAFTPVRLGPRVLRTETAALAMVAALQTVAGDFLVKD